jgi:osmotically-inducible protein OsmY
MVQVHEGRATLAGEVRSWADKVAARRAVMRVPGVTAIDDGAVRVRPDGAEARSDAQLARMARGALEGDGRVPEGAVRVEVQDGRVTLDGVLAHEDERAAAEDAVTPLIGVREVVNKITVPPRPRPPRLFDSIEDALRRALGREAKHVRIALSATGFELTGRVSTLALQSAAERAVRRVLGDVPLALRLH